MIFSFIVSAGGLFIMVLISLALRYYGGTIGFLLILVLNPIAGLVVAVLIQSHAEDVWGSDEEIREAEQKKLVAEQQRLDAERAAEQEAALQRIRAKGEIVRQQVKAEQEAERRRIEAEQEAKRKKKEAEWEAEKAIIEADEAAVISFWDMLVQNYSISCKMRDLVFDDRIPTVDINPDEPSVWVRNDERIKTIEDILRSAGFHINAKANGGILPGQVESEDPSPASVRVPTPGRCTIF